MQTAAGLGIGGCHAGVADMQLARDLLGFPGDRDWALLISLGYPADRPLSPIRTPSDGRSAKSCTAAAGRPHDE
jgi:hypothetical protein